LPLRRIRHPKSAEITLILAESHSFFAEIVVIFPLNHRRFTETVVICVDKSFRK
jgi:hypothetical protein